MNFAVVEGDITAFRADAVVNAANTSLLGGGGVDGAIHRAAGPELLAECRKLGGCETGKAKITGAYRLPARYIIHTPGPVWHGGCRGEDVQLESCYRSCLALAEEHGCKTVAFPSISTGVYRFPLERASKIAVKSILDFLSRSKAVESVTMVCFDPITKAAYDRAFAQERAERENGGRRAD